MLFLFKHSYKKLLKCNNGKQNNEFKESELIQKQKYGVNYFKI